MANNLKKSLEIIKARAQRLRRRDQEREIPTIKSTSVFTPAGAFPGDSAVPASDPLAAYRTGEPGTIEDIEPGEAFTSGEDAYYLIRSTGRAVDPQAPQAAEFFSTLQSWPEHVESKPFGARVSPGQASSTASPAVAATPYDRDSVCFLDIETTGLSPNTYVFLCGFMFFEHGDFVVEQVFARNYAEEAGLLRRVRETIGRFQTVVTYNGAKFDLPFIQTRMAVNRIPPLDRFASVDLLYTARRVFSGTLPNNKLGTVERHLRGLERKGDIPGKHIPEAYHDYVRTGDARVMKSVLYHNRMDLFTMAVFVNRLASEELI